MDTKREKELVDLLNKYDVAGLSFLEAKQKILAQGFIEAELVYGLYSAPFDGKVNAPRVANPLQEFYKQNPDRADKVAKELLLDQAKSDWNKTAAYTAASQFAPGMHAQSQYELKTADRLGIPYFTLLFLGVVITIVAIKLDLPKQVGNSLLFVFSLGVNIWFIAKLIIERRRVSKLRKDSKR